MERDLHGEATYKKTYTETGNTLTGNLNGKETYVERDVEE